MSDTGRKVTPWDCDQRGHVPTSDGCLNCGASPGGQHDAICAGMGREPTCDLCAEVVREWPDISPERLSLRHGSHHSAGREATAVVEDALTNASADLACDDPLGDAEAARVAVEALVAAGWTLTPPARKMIGGSSADHNV